MGQSCRRDTQKPKSRPVRKKVAEMMTQANDGSGFGLDDTTHKYTHQIFFQQIRLSALS